MNYLEHVEKTLGDIVQRNTVTYNAVISACVTGGQWQQELETPARVLGAGVQRNTIRYNAAISVCEKCWPDMALEWQQALHRFEKYWVSLRSESPSLTTRPSVLL